jgi:putative phosphoesterase
MRAADLILHGGDVVTTGALAELRALGPPVAAVCGNMDEPELQRELPLERVVEAGETRIAMLHVPGPAAGREARLAARFPDCHAVVYGHTHIPQVERFQHLWILNPGSPTQRRRAPTHTMLMLEIRGRRIVPELITLR